MPRSDDINFNINFKEGDLTALKNIKQQLLDLQKVATDVTFSYNNPGQANQLLKSITSATSALNKAYDVKLNAINIQKFNQALRDSGTNLSQLRQSLSYAGAEGDKAFVSLTSQLMKFNVVTKQSNAFLDNMAVTFFNTAKYIAFNSLFNTIGNTISRANTYVKNLDSSLNDIRIVTGKSADEMERFAESANKAAKQLAVTTSDYVEGSLIYYQQGLNDETVKTLTDITAMTSNVTGQSMSTVSEQLTAVWNGYQVANQAAKEGMQVYQEYVDKMAAVGATTASDLQELASAMSKVASAASAMGVDFDDLAAQIATIVSVTRQAPESVGTALKTIYARLGDLKVDGVDEFGTKLGEVSEQLRTMGIDILDTNGNMRQMSDVIAEVAAKWDTWTSAQKQAAAVAMAGKRQYNNLIALFDNWDMYGEALETSMTAAGTLEQQQEIALDSLANKMDQLSTTAEDLYDSLIDEDTLKGLIEGLTKVVQLMADFADATGGLNNLLPMLGMTAIRVFNKQIAQSLSTIIVNARNSINQEQLRKINEAELSAMYPNSSLFQQQASTATEQVRNQSVKELVDYYSKAKEYQSIMTKEEIAYNNSILDLQENIGKITIELAKQKEDWKANASQLKGIDVSLIDDLSDLEKITAEVGKIKRLAGDLSDAEQRRSRYAVGHLIYARGFDLGNGTFNPKTNKKQGIQFGFTDADSQAAKLLAKYDEIYNKTKNAEQAYREFINILNQTSTGTEKIIQLNSTLGETTGRVEAMRTSFLETLDTRALVQSITNTIGAIGQLATAANMVLHIFDVWKNEDLSTFEKLTQTAMSASMILPMVGSALKSVNETFKVSTFVTTLYNTALNTFAISSDVAAAATEGLNAAMLASPFAPLVIAIAALGAAWLSYTHHIEQARKAAQEQADEAKKQVEEISEQVKTHENLYESYEDVLTKYQEGNATKQELYDTTDQLIEAYGLESSRLHLLAGDYDAVTAAIRQARLEEEQEKKERLANQIKTTQRAVSIKYKGDAGLYGATFDNKSKTLSQDQLRDLLGKYYVEAPLKGGGVIFDTNDLTQMTEVYDRLLKVKQEASSEDSELVALINDIISENDLSELKTQQKEYLNSIFTTGDLAGAESQIDFQEKIAQIEAEYNAARERGDLGLSQEDIDKQLLSFVAKINTEFAEQFYIDETLKQKFTNGINEALSTAFHKYDLATQTGIINLGFDMENGTEQQLEAYAEYVKTTLGSATHVPVNFLDQINDQIADKGKDINKADWETLTSSMSVEAASLLGEREEFNNKLIGERISLLQQANELTMQQNMLAIESYTQNKETAQVILDANEASRKEKQAEIDDLNRSNELTQEQIQRLKELEAEIAELDSIDAKVKVDIDMDTATDSLAQSAINDVMSEADQLKVLAESIGDSWVVAAENVGTFASAFPDLMTEMEALGELTRQENGDLQLNVEYINQYLAGKQAQIEADKEVAKQAAQTKLKQTRLEIQFVEAQLELINQALNGEIEKEAFEEQLEQNAYDYKVQMEEAELLAEANALESAQKNLISAADGMRGTFENINQYIMDVNHNFAQMFEFNPDFKSLSDASSSFKSITDTSIDYQKLAAKGFAEEETDLLKEQQHSLEITLSNLKSRAAGYEGFISEMMNSVSEANKASNRVQQGLAGKEPTSSSSSKDKKDKELLKLDEEFDRYHDINKALDQMDRLLKKIDKDQQNLYDKELIRSLKQENELLANQAQLYEQLYAAQEAEAAELRGTLANSGITFDASGAVLNYAQATAEALKKYNDAITAYNQGILDDAALETHKQTYERFKKDLERYDTLFYTEMEETQEKIDDIRRNMLANNLKGWETEIELKLNFKELERDWNDFIKEVTSDFKKVFKDLRVDVKNMLADAKTYISDDGTINTIIGAVHNVTGEIDKMMAGGTSNMFESVSQAQEKLKELNDQLLDSSQALHDLWEEAWDNYLEGIEQVSDAFDDLLDRYERIDEELEFQQKLIELLYGDEAYKLMSKLYEGQEKNTMGQIQSVKQQVDMWKELFEASGASIDNQLDWDEDQKKYYEQWVEAQSKLNDLVIDYIELLKNDYLNTVSDVLQELEKYVTGSNLDNINTEWERISANADKYYDSVEGAYYIQTLANKIDQSIADTNDLKTQQKLIALREKEINYLREKETLTEYDIKAAELRYQIALKEIALENAQNNKTGMKLTRNEQGNWSYQYVADEDDVASKRQELLDAYNNLYQLASDAYEANLEALQELQEKYLESAKAIYEDDTLTEEERQAKLLELREWYLEQYKLLSEENQLYRDDLAAAGAGLLLEIYKQDEEAYESMTDNERALVDALISANIDDYQELDDAIKGNYENISDNAKEAYQDIRDKAREVMAETRQDWTSGAQTIADLWNKDNGSSVKTQVTKAYDQIEKANQQYQNAVDKCAEIVERDFSEEGITGAIQKAENETDALKDKTAELVNESIPYLQALKNYVDEIGAAWQSVQQEIMNAINLINEYLRKVGEANTAVAQQAEIATQQVQAQQAMNNNTGSNTNDKNILESSNNKVRDTSFYSNAANTASTVTQYNFYGNGNYGLGMVKAGTAKSTSNTNTDYQNYLKQRYGIGFAASTYATGGYTGDWGDSGKLAVLHEKELVLNADDTKNFLSGINTIRDLSSSVGGSIQDAVLKAVANTALSLGAIKANGIIGNIANNNSSTDNVFNITAEFPNANSVDDIREAILSLPNLASQYANSTLK